MYGILKGEQKKERKVYGLFWPQRCLHNEAERYSGQARLMECLWQVNLGKKKFNCFFFFIGFRLSFTEQQRQPLLK